MARPQKELDTEQFEKLCALQCTEQEICGWFSITDKTLDAWCKRTYGKSYSEVYEEKRVVGKISLRRAQWHLAEKNVTMAIWLGKQYLGQKDRIEYEDKESIARLDAILNGMKDNAVKSETE